MLTPTAVFVLLLSFVVFLGVSVAMLEDSYFHTLGLLHEGATIMTLNLQQCFYIGLQTCDGFWTCPADTCEAWKRADVNHTVVMGFTGEESCDVSFDMSRISDVPLYEAGLWISVLSAATYVGLFLLVVAERAGAWWAARKPQGSGSRTYIERAPRASKVKVAFYVGYGTNKLLSVLAIWLFAGGCMDQERTHDTPPDAIKWFRTTSYILFTLFFVLEAVWMIGQFKDAPLEPRRLYTSYDDTEAD